jgi:hypothetical protein
MAKKRIDPETKARWAEESRAFREMYERRLERMAAWEAAEERRRARLRRLTFGLLGRA